MRPREQLKRKEGAELWAQKQIICHLQCRFRSLKLKIQKLSVFKALIFILLYWIRCIPCTNSVPIIVIYLISSVSRGDKGHVPPPSFNLESNLRQIMRKIETKNEKKEEKGEKMLIKCNFCYQSKVLFVLQIKEKLSAR